MSSSLPSVGVSGSVGDGLNLKARQTGQHSDRHRYRRQWRNGVRWHDVNGGNEDRVFATNCAVGYRVSFALSPQRSVFNRSLVSTYGSLLIVSYVLITLSIGVLNRLLSLHTRDDTNSDPLQAATNDSAAASTWKLLIYDRYCQDILSPLLTVNELRQLGITLHMSLHARRERVPDIPAVYFVQPTEENIRLIAQDVKKGIYDSTHINFSTSVPSALLESFAAMVMDVTGSTSGPPVTTLSSGPAAASRIVRIMDQHCEFVSLEDRLFTLNHPESYPRLNSQAEAAMFAHVEEMVTALFGVCVTAGVVPIIRAKVGHAAELVATKLDAKLREHLTSRNNLFAAGGGGASALGFHRPLLILADRNIDLSAPLLHSWTYQALLHDLLHMSSNRVTVSVVDPPVPGQSTSSQPVKARPRTYDLLSGEDKFWKHHAGKVFPKVAEGVTERLQAYQTEFNNVTKKTGGAAVAAGGASDDLASAISALPKLQRRKKILDTHMNIATCLLKEIKARDTDVFFDLEQNLLQKQPVDKQVLASIFGGPSAPADAQQGKGSFEDRLRFLLVWYLQNGVTEDQLGQYKSLLTSVLPTSSAASSNDTNAAAPSSNQLTQSQLDELAALDYVQQHKFLHRLSAGEDSAFGGSSAGKTSASTSASSSGSSVGGMLGGFTKLADSLYGGGVGLLANVRNLLPSNNHLPLTRLVETLMLNRDGAESLDATWKYLDPKATGRRPTKLTGTYKEAMVFVLGGGNYNEYQNLQDWQKENHSSHGISSVVYGCSELVSPEQFMKQLANMHLATQQTQRANMPVD